MVAELETTLNFPIHQIGRTHDASNSGIEIIRTFNVDEYKFFQSVQRELQGRVFKDGDEWKRVPPLRDPYVRNCYCNRVRIDFADPDATCSMPGLDTGGATNIKDQLEKQEETLQSGAAGAIIKAHYRPLITAWVPDVTGDEDPDADEPTDVWDWMDPLFVPGFRQVPWPGGLYIKVKRPLGTVIETVPSDVSQPIGVSVTDFSIKRILVGEVPWDTIQASANAVNAKLWPAEGTPPANFLPQFKPRTLKFVGAESVPMVDAEGAQWFEITYQFKWLHTWTDRLFDKDGTQSTGWITWNHILHKPMLLTTGWRDVFLGSQFSIIAANLPIVIPGLFPFAGRLHNEVDFTPLFELNP